jgi:hypothetical protein
MLKWLAILAVVVLAVLFTTFSLSYGRSLRTGGIVQGRFNLTLAYTNYLATGRIQPNGSSLAYLFTNEVSIGATQYQCAMAIKATHCEDIGFLAMTTNQLFIFFDKKRGPVMIPSTGPYRAKLFPPGV